MQSPRAIALTIATCGLLIAPTFADAPFFMGLGDLPDGTPSLYGNGVSQDGSVVVGYGETDEGAERAFRWTASEGMVGLGMLAGYAESLGRAVSTNGNIAVGYCARYEGTERIMQAVRWTPDKEVTSLGDLPGGDTSSYALDVSPAGSIIVGAGSGASGYEAFRWTEETGMVGLGYLPGGSTFCQATGISADANIICGTSDSAACTHEAFRYTEQTGMVGLGTLGGPISQATDVSGDGTVIVGSARGAWGNDEAFRWTEAEGMVGLGHLPGGDDWGAARDTSYDGSVIVGRDWGAEDGFVAFIWDPEHGMRSLADVLANDYGLDMAGWQLNDAVGVSEDGRTIVGLGVNPDGHFEAFIAHIPEPATLSLLAIPALLIGRRRC